MSLWKRVSGKAKAQHATNVSAHKAAENEQERRERRYQELLKAAESYINRFRTIMKKAKNPGLADINFNNYRRVPGWRTTVSEFPQMTLSIYKDGNWKFEYETSRVADTSTDHLGRSNGRLGHFCSVDRFDWVLEQIVTLLGVILIENGLKLPD